MEGIIAVDLFCGAGGLTRGLLDAGIKVKKGFDINSKFKETYEKNNPGVCFSSKDVSSLTRDEILQGIDLKNNYFLLAGCAPCQPFSRINNQDLKEDDRKSLLLEFGRLVEQTKPNFIFIENVPGLATGKGKEIFEKFRKKLDDMDYNYICGIVDAKNYGVPQKRKRLILLASDQGSIDFPEQSHGKGESLVPYVKVREVISGYPVLRDGSKHNKIPNHETRTLSEKNRKRLSMIKKNGGSRKELPEHLKLDCHTNHKGHTDVYGRMRWDEVAPTLTCKCTSISNGRFGHPTQRRGISVREAAALQTFDDDYVFYEGLTFNSLMVGNAVPPLLAKKMGEVFLRIGVT